MEPDTWMTKEPVCPHCGEILSEAAAGEINCLNCGGGVVIYFDQSPAYMTEKT